MATKDGKIVDEINGLIASRDSIRTTMKAANIASDTSKLADLAAKLSNAKLAATTYNVSKTDQAIIPAGKLTTGAQTIRAVTTSGISAANIKSGAVVKVGDAGSANRITEVTGTFTKEDNNPITAATVLSGKVGYVNGNKVTGNIPTVTPSTTDPLICGASASIPKGYLASAVTITAKDLASQTSGTAAAGDIRLNKTAWVAGKQVTGTMPNGSYSASVSTTAGSASMAATGVPTSTSTTDCYITLSTSAGSVTGTATIGTAGWIDKGSKSSSATSVSVSGNDTKLYLAINHYYTSANLPSSSDGNNGDVWMVIA